jgi:ABC-type transport system involved in multi-copper enzyme maturation permease subunit
MWFYGARALFVAALLALVLTSWQLLVGSQRIENLGDLAWFGAAVFQILAPLQLAVAMPLSALLVAAAVAHEKDRKTLDLLLMTNLSNAELVLGKLLASMLTVLVVVVAVFPLLMIVALLGGVDYGQILGVQTVTVASALVAGSLGSTLALWRDKTFQALAMTLLVLVLWLAAWEVVGTGALGDELLGVSADTWAVAMSPWKAVQAASRPEFTDASSFGVFPKAVNLYLFASVAGAVILNTIAIAMVRVWNPSRESQRRTAEQREPQRTSAASAGRVATSQEVVRIHGAGGKVRRVWDNPILWREIRTWAYGKRILLIRVAYWVMFAVCALAVRSIVADRASGVFQREMIPAEAEPLAALLVVSLILLNALAVTSLTSERDSKALDLLLVTDLLPKEIVFGKLGGAFYNAKEMIILPIVLCGYLWYAERIAAEQFFFLVCGLAVMNAFAATLGLHAGMTYSNSRTAIATSIGTLLFLFLGVATCMRIMLAFSSSFQYQLTSFLGFMAGGGVGLFVALGWRNPSRAIFMASLLAPFATFFVLTSFLLGEYDQVFLVTVATYGFATAAMLVPAVSEFDVATGRTIAREE